MQTSMVGASPRSSPQRSARRYAEELERNAADYPDERAEILLEAAGQYAIAGEHQRALDIFDDLIATAPGEDAQWATASKLDVLDALGRMQDAENEIRRFRQSQVRPGPAGMVAEFLEHRGRLEEALDWFNLACRDYLALEDPAVTTGSLMTRPELLGRARVRKALGLPPDTLDERVGKEHADFVQKLDRFPGRDDPSRKVKRPAYAAGFFVRGDVKRAFAEGLVHVDDPSDDDVESYFRRCERNWRTITTDNGSATQQILPTTVDDLLAYAGERGQNPADDETRADHLQQRIREGAPTLTWPPERNAPCWCGSHLKYKKCCGSPSNR